MPVPAVSENFADLLEPGFRKIFTDQYREMPSMIDSLFTMLGSGRSLEEDSSVGAFGDFNDFTQSGTVTYDDVVQGYDTTFTHREYASGFKVERKLFDDDLYGVMNKKPRGLAISAKRTREKHGASLFNNAFTSTGPTNIMTGGDSQFLCDTDHPSNATTTTQSNDGSSALSATTVEATRRLMVKFLDDKDNKIAVNPDLLLAPRSLEQTAWEIIASKGQPDTANNNANFHFGKYKLAVWDYLDNANNWFFIDSMMMKQFLNWFDRIPLEFAQDRDFDTLIAKYRAYMRYSYGWSDWRWIFGHEVS